MGIYIFRTAHVAFFLVAQERHLRIFHEAAGKIQLAWNGQIEVASSWGGEANLLNGAAVIASPDSQIRPRRRGEAISSV